MLFVIALLGWFAALATGRMPTGLRNLGAFAIRYGAQTNAYWLVVTDDYPHASPALARRRSRSPSSQRCRIPRCRAGAAGVSTSRRRLTTGARRVGGRPARARRPGGIAAWSLWQSVVPDDLVLGHGSLAGIPQETLERADRYELFFRVEFVVSQLVLLGVLVVYAKCGIRFARESAAGRIGTGMLLGMIGLALVWLSQVPFRVAEVWWDRRYDQTDGGYSRHSSRTGSSSGPSSCSSASRS